MKWIGKIIAVLAALAFVGVGPASIGYGLLQIQRATAATAWPSVTGTLTSCELKTHHSSKSTTYRCQVTYRYKVEGVSYKGNQISFGYNATNKRKTHDALHYRLKDASQVKVYYNPHDPHESVLAPGVFRSAYLPVAFGGAWLTFCVGVGALFFLENEIARIPQRVVVLN